MNTLLPIVTNNTDRSMNSFVSNFKLVLGQVYWDEEITIPQIAEQLNMDEVTLWRKVQKYCKTNPQLFLRNFRLDKSLQMFFDPEKSVSEIAHLSGFKSLQHFSRVFKTRYGLSPNRYRSDQRYLNG